MEFLIDELPASIVVRDREETRRRIIETGLKEGDDVWVYHVEVAYSGVRLKRYVKPELATITHIRLEGYPTISVQGTKFRGQINSWNAGLALTEDGARYLHDQRIIEVAEQIGKKNFQRKQNMYKKLLITPPPVDDVLNAAIAWHEELEEREQEYVKKLIAMSQNQTK